MNVETLFREALKKSPAERAAFLDAACAGQPELRAAVEDMLASHEVTGGAANAPSKAGTEATLPHTPDPERGDRTKPVTTELYVPAPQAADPAAKRQPAEIGMVIANRYTLVEVIGEGGMGSVYRASQTEPVRRQVALKLIKSGLDSKGVLARFDAERQALALMDHPSIARVYDGGTTPTGQPFFAMELVHGVPLTKYCDAHRLPVEARLQLFVQICQAVQHAHQKGIIHRDLKPGNVLVTEVDGQPTPKIIDFGVAKAIEQKLTDMSFSDVGAIVGTPVYMSPEQADPTSMDIDTRTDVYALGVMLYELLVGSPPLDTKQFKRGAVLEMLRMVRDVEPPRPSTKLSTADALPNIAANRNIEPARLAKLLRGELDWVVMKALEKDRRRRYETASGLARDIQRYLTDEVVEARPPSRGYRLRKFVRRNRGQVIAVSLVLLAVLGGLAGVVAVQRTANQRLAEANQQITEQRDEAERQRGLATQAKTQAEQNEQLAKQQAMLALTSMQLIVTDIDRKLAAAPGTANLRIGLLQTLEKKWDELDMAMTGGVEGEAIPTLTAVRVKIAEAWVTLDKIAEANAQYEKLFDQAEQRLSVKGRNDSSRFNLAYICRGWAPIKARLTGNPGDAAALRARAVALLREIRSDPRPQTGSPPPQSIADVFQGVLIESASAFVKAGDRAKAEAAYDEVGELCESILREADANAEWFAKLKPADQKAIQLYFAQNLEISRAGRANNLCALGKVDDAVAIYRGIIERSRAAQAGAPEDANSRAQLAVQLGNYGQYMQRVGRTEDAAALLAESLELVEKNFSADPTDARQKRSYGHALYYLGVARDAQGRAADAAALFAHSRAIREEMHAISADSANKVNLMLAQARVGNVDATKALADELSASKNKDPDVRLDVARAMAQLSVRTDGEVQESFRTAAFAALERCLDEGQQDQFAIASQQDLAPIKEDPRFRAILSRLAPTDGTR
jgi:tetratricopeptide (TPR) repeat protein